MRRDHGFASVDGRGKVAEPLQDGLDGRSGERLGSAEVGWPMSMRDGGDQHCRAKFRIFIALPYCLFRLGMQGTYLAAVKLHPLNR